MLLIRPIQPSDLPALLQIAEESGTGFTSLPVNKKLLQQKIDASVEAFSQLPNEKAARSYLLVAEDVESGEVVGTSGVEAAVGMSYPFYTYHLGTAVHASQRLGVYNSVEILTLTNDFTGASELCSLFLRQAYRGRFHGQLLSRSRFLFMAEFRQGFDDRVIAEMRGVSDEQGRSPFWEWLQTHFFSLDFPTADHLTGLGNRQFIAELMPKYPVYVSLLSEAAQAVIGEVHEQTRPAIALLEKEGFHRCSYVDIFDAGPTVLCHLDNIATVRNSSRLPVVLGEPLGAHPHLISNTHYQAYRALVAPISVDKDRQVAVLPPEIADKLLVSEGDVIRCVAL